MIPLLFIIHLPLLPLETLRPSWSEPGRYAVLDREQVLVASAQARHDGVTPGMRAGGVATMAPATIMLERDLDKERAALDAIALALMQFTPEVAFTEDFSLVLDVGASLRLFGGPLMLSRRVADSMRALGFTARLGAAPTARGAWLLARAGRVRGQVLRRRCLRTTTLRARLERLPCALLPATQPFGEWLQGVGARDLGALRRLPRTGLLRRTSKQLLADLDRAYGDEPELHRWLSAPAAFSAHVETFDRIEQADALMFGATRLILQMIGWLTAQQLAVTSFTLAMEHERGRDAVAPSLLEIVLAEPAWKEPHLLRLLKERLAKVELTAPVIGLRLSAGRLVPMAPPTTELFPEPGGTPEDFTRLLELLSARLGAENVLTPVRSPDHRPELAYTWVPATHKPRRMLDEDELLERPSMVLGKPVKLLMRADRPFYGSPLKLIKGPERIEAGWWNDQIAARDYYVGQGNDGACFWIFLERTSDAHWFLHGLYA